MKKKMALVAAAVLACGVAHAQGSAESPLYGEVGYTALGADVAGVDLDLAMVRGILGYEADPHLAVELMLGLGTREESVRDGVDTLKIKVDRSYGLYLKPKGQLTDTVELFGRIGIAQTKLKGTLVGYGSASDSDADMSFGAGLKIQFSKSAYASFDYMNYYDKDEVDIDGFTLSIGVRF